MEDDNTVVIPEIPDIDVLYDGELNNQMKTLEMEA